MNTRVLIMGLPGSGKSTLASKLHAIIGESIWLNGDALREEHNDWDFSEIGRIRQAHRMRYRADDHKNTLVIMDFVCPLEEMREIVDPGFIIWMNPPERCREYEDTSSMFEPPTRVHLEVTSFEYTDELVEELAEILTE